MPLTSNKSQVPYVFEVVGIDTPDDLRRAELFLSIGH
jgi:hypothetical protein